MLNQIWSVMMLTGLVWGAIQGNLDQVTQGLIESSGEAVTIGIAMMGILSFWNGILKIARRAGVIDWLTAKMDPVLDFLFPALGRGHPARGPIAVNIAANLLGLGMAATPAGIEAMKAMKAGTAGETQSGPPDNTATSSMCTFLILNISSLQLLPMNMIAYRSQYGSAEPAVIVGPALAATGLSTLAAIIFCKSMDLFQARRTVGPR